MFLHKKGNNLNAENMLSFEETNAKIWDLQADIFIPGAASKILNRDQMDRLMANGMQVMSCGANVPFVDDEVFFGPTARYTDEKISIIPDFIANCGMARVFAYLMSEGAEVTDQAIFTDVSDTILKALENSHSKNQGKTKLSQTSYEIALAQLM